MKLLLSIALACLSASVIAQPALQIIDSATGQPVAYATIRVQHQNRGYYADAQGRLAGISFQRSDTLIIGCVGYTNTIVPYAALRMPAIIRLQAGQVLEEVVVQPFPQEIQTVPFLKKKGMMSYTTHSKMEFVCKVVYPPEAVGKRHMLQEVRIRFKDWDSKQPIRLRVYAVGADGKPGADILQQNLVIQKADAKGGMLRLDVSPYKIVTTEDAVYVGIEWLTDIPTEERKDRFLNFPRLVMTNATDEVRTYIRLLSDPEYAWHDGIVNMDGKVYNMLVSVSYR